MVLLLFKASKYIETKYLSKIVVDKDKMTQTAKHDKYMKQLMVAKIFPVIFFEKWQL